MTNIHCNKCDMNRKVIGFKRDDPILECGHIKSCNHDNINAEFCTVCSKITTVFVDKYGVRRCGGNLLDDSGCGCRLDKPIKRAC